MILEEKKCKWMGYIKLRAWFSKCKQDSPKQKQKDEHYFAVQMMRDQQRAWCLGGSSAGSCHVPDCDHMTTHFKDIIAVALSLVLLPFLYYCVLFLTSLFSWKVVWLRLLKSSPDPQWGKIGHPRSRWVVGILYVSQHRIPHGYWLKSGNYTEPH